MTTYGVTETGFVKKTISDIKSEIEQAERDSLGSGLNLLATSVLGQLNGIFADKFRELWDVAEAVYRSFYPDSATGEALDNVAAITGTIREAAVPSTVSLRLFLDDGVTVPAGSQVSVGTTGARFQTLSDVSNSLGYKATVSVDAESVDTGPIVGLAGSIDTIQSPISGWSAATAVSSGNSEPFNLDDGQHLIMKIDGQFDTAEFNTADFVDINAATAAEVAIVINTDVAGVTASDEGGFVRITNNSDASGNSIQITGGAANPILGFSTDLVKGFNVIDAELGANLETDAEFRDRREDELEVAGSSTVEAIKVDVLQVLDVVSCRVFENDTDTATGTGGWFLPHSINVVVLGGEDLDIARAIWLTKPAGIQTVAIAGPGYVSCTITDSQGFDHEINFNRPVEVPIYISATVELDDDPPVDIDDQIKTRLILEAENYGIGDEVIALHFHAAPLDVSGVRDVTTFLIDTVNPPVASVNIPMDERELPVFDSTQIEIIHA